MATKAHVLTHVLTPRYPTGYVQWDIYNVIRRDWAPYCGMAIATPEIKKEEFQKTMQFGSYVKMDGQLRGRKYVIAILDRGSDGGNPISDMTEKFKLFHNSLAAEGTTIIVVSPKPFMTHVVNYIVENKLTDTIRRFPYDHFKAVAPLLPNFPKYRILDEAETKAVLEDCYKSTKNIQPIALSDCGVEWVMADPGHILEIERTSGTAGRAVTYRRVIKSGLP